MTHSLVGFFLGCVSEVVSFPLLPYRTQSCSPAWMLVCISVDPLSVRPQGLPGFWGQVPSGSPKEVKGCQVTPASVTGEAEMRRMKILLRQAGTETREAEK